MDEPTRSELKIQGVRRFKPYPTYRDSGVEWLGMIPADWNGKRLKYLISKPLKYGANEAAELDDPDLPRFIRITDINEDGSLRDETFKSLPQEIAEEYLLQNGDMLFARSGATAGKTFLYFETWGRAAFAGYLIRARFNHNLLNPRLAWYFTQSNIYWDWLMSSFIQATIQNVSAEKYANLLIPIPRREEQQNIIAFLDRETAKIDALVAKKERLIELLQEKRTALITRAVTKGLDPNVPMKDSGVEWLGKIPTHWEVKRLKYVARLRSGEAITFSAIGETGEYPVYGGNGLRGYTSAYTHEGEFPLIGRQGALCGCINYAQGRFWASEHAVVATPTAGNLAIWLRALLLSMNLNQYSESAAQPGLAVETIAGLQVSVPPVEDQRAIADFLDRAMETIDALIAKIREGIEKLKEYRIALISAAVTGKIDVREEGA